MAFGEKPANELEQHVIQATGTAARIENLERFLLGRFENKGTIGSIVKSTAETILATKGNIPINAILRKNLISRRQ